MTASDERVDMSGVELEIQHALEEEDSLPDDESFRRWVEAALAQYPLPVELVIRLVDEEESRQLNHAYRGKESSTNVLSFPFEAPPEVPSPLLGDLVICVPVVAREAREQGKTLESHWAHMVIHGLLHLLGYDHQNDEEAQRMESRERELLDQLQYPDPYNEEDR
ncbi:MAG: rRNA maturation RNase YbeY [Chromatiales bacterium]|jgi:probable rRNA maturation factor